MYTQRKNGPLARVKKGYFSNLPEDCKALNIGTWNTRTLFHDFKLEYQRPIGQKKLPKHSRKIGVSLFSH